MKANLLTTYNQRLIMGKRSLNRAEILILFIIWPFLGLLAACGQFQNRKTRFICVLFGALFGYTFVVGNESIDSYRYVVEFQYYAKYVNDWAYWFELSSHNYGVQFFVPLMNSIVSLFTDNYHLLYAIYGMLFSYFMTKTVGILYDCNKNTATILKLLLVILLLSLNFIFNINGVRMWLAMWVICYALLAYWNGMMSKSCCYMLLVLSVFVHWSYFFVFLLFVFYNNVNLKKEFFLYVFILASFAIRAFFSSIVQSLPFISAFYEDKVMLYTSEEGLERAAENRQNMSFLYGMYKILFSPAVLLLLMYIRKGLNLWKNAVMQNMYCFALIVYAISNTAANASAASRFFVLFQYFAVFFMYSALSYISMGKKRIVTICLLPLLGFSIVNAMLLGRTVTSPNLFLPVPFYIIQSSSSVI